MSIKKMSLVAAGAAVLMLAASAMAQAQAPAPAPAQTPAPAHTQEAAAAEHEAATAEEAAAEEAAAEEAAIEAKEEAAAEAEVAAHQPAPEPVAAVPEPAKVEKPKPVLEVTPYGTASYRFRGRLWDASADTGSGDAKKSVSGSTKDYFNLLGWFVGLKAKVDDQLTLEFRIGNDFNSGEEVNWAANKAPQGRSATDNLYVHLAYATWNPGPVYLSGGVIPISSNGTLDLLERSLTTGSYGDAIFQTWQSQLNNRLIAIKLGAPILKDNFKLGVELTSSVIDNRTTRDSLITDYGTTGATGKDSKVKGEPTPNPASVLLIVDVPMSAGDLKITPEFTTVINRNFAYRAKDPAKDTTKKAMADHEFIGGLSASYKVNKELSLSLNGAYGTVSNENSRSGFYGKGSANSVPTDTFYVSTGWIAGLGCTYKVGPGSVAFDFKYGNAVDAGSGGKFLPAGATDSIDAKTATNKDDILVDLRYTWNVHPKFSIQPRWRLYMTMYDEKSGHISQKMENRPELILTGSF